MMVMVLDKGISFLKQVQMVQVMKQYRPTFQVLEIQVILVNHLQSQSLLQTILNI